MPSGTLQQPELHPQTAAFYRSAIDILQRAGIPFLVGGAHALLPYTGIFRNTKDFDVFLRRDDCLRGLELFAAEGHVCDLTFPHWLGKVHAGDDFVDLIFCSGNGLCPVDEEWFVHAVEAEVLDRKVRLCPPEEIIWQKCFIMERERFDGADVAHLLRAYAAALDWPRLLRRFGRHWRILFAQLVLFGYIYPAERDHLPTAVLEELQARLRHEMQTTKLAERVCRGTNLSREQYLIDIQEWGYRDARSQPQGPMNAADIDRWTAGIGEEPAVPTER
jgi:hypothetical protein